MDDRSDARERSVAFEVEAREQRLEGDAVADVAELGAVENRSRARASGSRRATPARESARRGR